MLDGSTEVFPYRYWNGKLKFSADGRSASFEVAMQPDQQYQLLIGEGFRTVAGVRLKPFLIDFKTNHQ